MWILIIYLKNSFSYNELEELVNETNSFSKRAYLAYFFIQKFTYIPTPQLNGSEFYNYSQAFFAS